MSPAVPLIIECWLTNRRIYGELFYVGGLSSQATVKITHNSGNEAEVGQGIKDSGVPRKDIFITSKLWNTHHPNVKEGLQKTLDSLGTDYLDLYVRALSFCMRPSIWSDEVSISLFIGPFGWFQ